MALRKKPTRQIGSRAAGGHRGMLPLLCLSVCAAPAMAKGDAGEALGFSRRKGVSLGDRFTWGSTWALREDLRLGYTLQWVDAVHRDAVERDGYQVHDVQLQWRPGFARRLELQLAVNNLLDAQYSSQASAGSDAEAAPEPGRDVRLTARYRF